MLGVLTAADTACAAAREMVKQEADIRPLPGTLDNIPVFNSNSPELIEKEGILLSLFPPEGMSAPEAHLNYPLNGRFDLFSHHITKGSEEDPKTLYLGFLLKNPTEQKIKITVLSGASYLSQPEAPFIKLKPIESNDDGKVFSGPGDRVTNDVLRNRRQSSIKKSVSIAPGKYVLLLNLPIPVRTLTPHLNGRSTLLRLVSSGPVYTAGLAMFAPNDHDGNERAPTVEEWIALLKNASLAGPRDKAPTPPESKDKIIYGRVSGVAKGSNWTGSVEPELALPEPGSTIAYPICSLDKGRFGTGQVQSAPILVRYPDTAYQANGNYAVQYTIALPLVNAGEDKQRVAISFENPLKEDTDNAHLSYYVPPPERAHFRGTVLLKYKDECGNMHKDYWHIVANQGEELPPLMELTLKPGDRRTVTISFLYPPDATPPQALTIKTLPP